MTSLQIKYWELQEAKLHNRETERLQSEYQNELARHNVASEGAAFAQAAAAARQADISAQLAQLQALRTEYDVQIAQHQMQLIDSQRRYQQAQTDYTRARTYQQSLESGVYATYGAEQARVSLQHSVVETGLAFARTRESTASRQLTEARTATESITQMRGRIGSASDVIDIARDTIGLFTAGGRRTS